MNEDERIKQVYDNRLKSISENKYSFFNPAYRYMMQEVDDLILKKLSQALNGKLKDKIILDVGCGTGNFLRKFVIWGAEPTNLYGIDLITERIELAKKLSPNINFYNASAENINHKDNSIDIVFQSTVFTSILDNNIRTKIASEILRVLKDEGIILWYDFRYNNPKNMDVKGIGKSEIIKLFSECNIHVKAITLAPPLLYKTIKFGKWFVKFLSSFKFLNSHYFAVIQKKSNLKI